jgi:hypothetical protein
MKGDNEPSFRPLLKEHKSLFDAVFKECPPQISEFTFTNLFAWRNIYRLSFGQLDGFYIIRSDASSGARFFPPLGRGDEKKAVETLIFDFQGTCIRVPEALAKACAANEGLVCSFDPDNSDYLYSCQDLINLKGRKYDGKRNLIKRFKSAFRYEYEVLNQEAVQECLAFQEQWCEIKECDKIVSLGNEHQAIVEILENFSDFTSLIGAIVRVQGRISALAIAEPLNPSTLVMHVLKANPNFPGLYQTLTQEFLAHQAASFSFVNFEQDLGVQGLRKAKQSYHPLGFIKKYIVASR